MATYNGFKSIEGKEFYERALLKNLKENNIFLKLATKSKLPKNHGDTITWRKRKPIPVQYDGNGKVRTIVEGITPTGNKLEFVEFKSTIKEYGDYIPLTKKLTNLAIDPILTEASEGLGESAGLTFEMAIIEELEKNPNVFNAGGSTFSSSTYATVADLHKMMAVFKRRNVKPAVDGKYILVISPEVEYDFKSNASGSFIDIAKYTDVSKKYIMDGEIGSLFGFKLIVNNHIKSKTFYNYNPVTPTATTDVTAGGYAVIENGAYKVLASSDKGGSYAAATTGYPVTGVNYYKQSTGTGYVCFALGRDAFGTVDLEGSSAASPEMIYNKPGSQGNDPLHLKHSVGWHVEGWATRVIYPEALIQYNVASSLSEASDWDDADGYYFNQEVAGTAGKYQSYDVQDSTANPSSVITD